jgi:hypothetical protein
MATTYMRSDDQSPDLGQLSEDTLSLFGVRDATAVDLDVRPTFFRLRDPEDRTKLETLLSSTFNIRVFDTLGAQLGELIRARNPKQRLTPLEIKERVKEHLGATHPTHYGVWVHYRWSNHLVHLLDEAEFIELRTNRNSYKITPEEHHQLCQKRVGVIGLSVGQSAALTMAMERSFGEIRLADFDNLELSNLNRLRSGVHNIGVPKVILAAREIAEIDPYLKVTCLGEGITEDNIDRFMTGGGKLDVIIEECDSMDIKYLTRYRARELGIPVVMETSDRGLLDVERFDLEPDRPAFHGLTETIDYHGLRGLSNDEKLPIVLRIVGAETMSARMKASLVEVEESICTWPQLASSVVLGGALIADVVRRILLNQYQASGRYFVDVQELVRDPKTPPTSHHTDHQARTLSQEDIRSAVKSALQAGTMPSASVELAPHQIHDLVAAGILAPSGGNCQPWKWTYREKRLFLFHDEQRSASFLDFADCASYIALGAASENVILKAHALGLSVHFQLFPLPQDRRLVAAFGFSAEPAEGSESHIFDPLVDDIASRATNRRVGQRRPIPRHMLASIQEATESVPGARLHLVQDPSALTQATDILGAVERLRLLHPLAYQDLMNEIRWSSDESQATRDGIDVETMELSVADHAALEVCRDWSALELLSVWGRGKALSRFVRKAVESASCIALITMPDATPESCICGGRAIQRAWLTATEHQIAFQPLFSSTCMFARLTRGAGVGMSSMMRTELTAMLHKYLDLFALQEGRAEVMLFRLAIVDAPRTTALRRPVTDVFVQSSEASSNARRKAKA